MIRNFLLAPAGPAKEPPSALRRSGRRAESVISSTGRTLRAVSGRGEAAGSDCRPAPPMGATTTPRSRMSAAQTPIGNPMMTIAKGLLKAILSDSAFKQLLIYRQKLGTRRFTPETVRHKYGSTTLSVRIADPLARSWYDRDWDELPEFIELRTSSLRLGARVFNCGAHQGVVAALLASEVGPSGEVVALEANPHNARMAQANRDLNGLQQLQILPEAISDTIGELNFNEDLNGQVDPRGGKIKVRCRTVDSLTQEFGRPDLVTIDVEGFECAALRGARQTIADFNPDVFIEVHVNCGLEDLGGSVRALIEMLPASMYRFLITVPDSGGFEELDFTKPGAFDHGTLQARFYMIAKARSRHSAGAS